MALEQATKQSYIGKVQSNKRLKNLIIMNLKLAAAKGELELFLYDAFLGKRKKRMTEDDQQRMAAYRQVA